MEGFRIVGGVVVVEGGGDGVEAMKRSVVYGRIEVKRGMGGN